VFGRGSVRKKGSNRATLQATASGVASSGANTAAYTYPGISDRLQNITGNVTKNFTYDAICNTLTETGGGLNNTFTFDHKNRLEKVRVGAVAVNPRKSQFHYAQVHQLAAGDPANTCGAKHAFFRRYLPENAYSAPQRLSVNQRSATLQHLKRCLQDKTYKCTYNMSNESHLG
jgi:hypothetical protein